MAAGIMLYDQLGGAKSVPAQKHLTRAGALRLSPGLKRSSLIGGIRYYDTVVDDARHDGHRPHTQHWAKGRVPNDEQVGFQHVDCVRVVGLSYRSAASS